MKLVSFDALRTLTFPAHTYIKPDLFLHHRPTIEAADWVLFAEHWQLNPLVFGLKARIFPSLPTYLIGHDKVQMTRAFEAIVPASVPLTLIHGNTPAAADRVWDILPLPFVAKLPKASMGEGVFLIEDRAGWDAYCARTNLLYAQEYLPIDRDLRLIVIGERVVGGYWRVQQPGGFYNNVARGGSVLAGPIPPAARQLVEHTARALGIDHAGFDVAMVGNHPYLLEFNRLFGTVGVTEHIGDLTPHILDYLRAQMDESDPRRPRPAAGVRLGRHRTRSRRAG